MADEPSSDGGGGRPKFVNNVTAWIGGLTAVVVALGGLKAAYNQLESPTAANATDTEDAASTNEVDVSTNSDMAAEAPAPADLPSKYTGTWEGQDVTLELRNGIWVETLGNGTVTRYEQLSRDKTSTNGIDRNRNLYVRWPTDGGTLEESEDNDTWTRSYDVTAA